MIHVHKILSGETRPREKARMKDDRILAPRRNLHDLSRLRRALSQRRNSLGRAGLTKPWVP